MNLFRPILSGLAIILLATGCAHYGPRAVEGDRRPMPDDGIARGFILKSVEANGEARRYSVYVPADYDPSKAWPLMVFLHGMGERGSDGLKQTEVGIGPAIRMHPERFPCIVLMPQCPEDSWWGTIDRDWARDLKDATPIIDAALAKTRSEYQIDPQRITLTGLSMGGYGTFQYGAENVDTFAAFMPLCGGGRPDHAPALAKRPMWVIHGGADEVVPPERSRQMVDAIKEAGGEIEYTEYEDVGHNCWDRAYGDPQTIRWLLRQELGV